MINKHGIRINDISQGDKLEVKIFPDSEEIYIIDITSDPTYDIENNQYICGEIIKTDYESIVPKNKSDRITNFDRIINIRN